jgi:hypothetical protein
MTIWHDRPEMGGVLGHGSCSEPADCARDTCKQLDPKGGLDCAPMGNIREHIAAFQLIRGEFIHYKFRIKTPHESSDPWRVHAMWVD